MGRINNTVLYNYDNNVSINDYVIGSDAENNGKTKNFKIRSILNILEANVEGVNSLIEYQYDDSTSIPGEGKFYFQESGGNITNLVINKQDINNTQLSNFFSYATSNTDYSLLRFSVPGNPSNQLFLRISSVTDNGTYLNMVVSAFGSNSTYSFTSGNYYRINLELCIDEVDTSLYDDMTLDGNGNLNLIKSGQPTLSVNLDSRYLTSLYDDMTYDGGILRIFKDGEPVLATEIGCCERNIREVGGEYTIVEDDDVIVIDTGSVEVQAPLTLPALTKNKKFDLVLFSPASIDAPLREFAGTLSSRAEMSPGQTVSIMYNNAESTWTKVNTGPILKPSS